MELKDTLLMPKTEFKMRGNLPENEKVMREKWEGMNLYHKALEGNKKTGKGMFILHDGPPYANNNIHIGHALNKVLKDFINRHKMLAGFEMVYIPGWDVHGLPIETEVTKSGVDRKKHTKAEFRKFCEDYAKEQIIKQKEQFKSLNVIGDWENPYITMAKDFEAAQLSVFAKMVTNGLIYKGLKPVYWSPSSESALAENEIEYKDRTDFSIFSTFEVVDGKDVLDKGDKLVTWTTTPWTLPGNLAITVGEDFDYSKVKVGNEVYVVATELVENLMIKFGFENYEETKTFKGSELSNVKYRHCFEDKDLPVVLGDHVTLDSGTGLVHTAPGYGADDFEMGKKYNLGLVNGIDDKGYLTKESFGFEGLFYEDANKEIIEKLEQQGDMLKVEKINHSYPHDWRTKKPVIFRATNQWFCSIDKIRDDLLKELDESVEYDRIWGKNRIRSMISDRGDWCISRQRAWGVPIPVFYNEDGSEILDFDVIMHVSNLFREHGSNIWFEWDAKDLLPKGYTNPASPNGGFKKEEDIMDVWFDSGTTHTGVLIERGLPYPADVYMEGSDQYRGWFNSSLICGVAAHKQAPYKKLISTGFVLDAKGHKMSKSVGNVVDPLKLIGQNGSDIFRLWVASADYREDIRYSDESLKQIKENYRKLRNTYRFMLGNLFDFDPSKDLVSYENMPLIDKYMLIELNELNKNVLEAYDKNNYQDVSRYINNFVSFKLSSFYLDFTKDVLYIENADSNRRRSVQSVIYKALNDLVLLMAVITPYTSEEVYLMIPGDRKDSVHLDHFPEVLEYENYGEVLAGAKVLLEVKDATYKALEEARMNKVIGKGLEAIVYLNVDDKTKDTLNKFDNLAQLLIVSKLEFTNEKLEKYDDVMVKVEKFDGVRCERCWTYFNEDEMQGEICNRCHNIVN